MNKSCSNRHDSLNRYHYTTIPLYPDKYTLYSLKNTAGDTDTIPSLHGIFCRGQINHLLIIRTGNSYKMAHLNFRNNDRLPRFTIHNIAKRKMYGIFLLYFIYLFSGSMNEDQIMYCRNKLANPLLFPGYIFIAHRNEILNIIPVQKLFQSKLPAIGDTQSVPICIFANWFVHFRSVQKRIFLGDTGGMKPLPVKTSIRDIEFDTFNGQNLNSLSQEIQTGAFEE